MTTTPAVPAAREDTARTNPEPRPSVPEERPARTLPGWGAVLVAALAGAVALAALVRVAATGSRPATGLALGCGLLAVYAAAGVQRVRPGTAHVLTLAGRYRGTVRRAGLVWADPLPRRVPVDLALRHWRGGPFVVGEGERVSLLVVWQVAAPARAAFGVENAADYLRDAVEAAAGAVRGESALTARVAADAAAVGLKVHTVRPLHTEPAPHVALLDAVERTVTGLTARGLLGDDPSERRAMVRALTVALTAKGEPPRPAGQGGVG
ncbi:MULTISPECIES: hypothetical protein [unclassified Streptomyces]|uniref:hypothetical protein n=1 Tax=unclassified Streptomyces TaxID=2593676 RepID=UPI00081D9FAB|nr:MULTISPECIES: hypothetical protein [unclassified Streptomyces]SCE86368.1 hypothetical protein GA0115257_10352 [Streptomyces sp. LcepLS]